MRRGRCLLGLPALLLVLLAAWLVLDELMQRVTQMDILEVAAVVVRGRG